MNKKKMIITGACGSLVIGLSAFAGYEYGKHQVYETTPLVQNTAQAKKINYSDKVSSVVVSEITEDGYVTLHGDHSHYEKGLVPYNAKILDSLVYKNKDYKLKNEDIQYELAEGYVIKVNGKYYYYPKEGTTQNNVVDEKTAKEISAHAHHHHHHSTSSETKEGGDNYTFNPKDIVSETQDGYVVRHGDHFHYIKKSELSSSQLSQAKEAGVNPSLASSAAGVTTPTSDGYIFKGESDIIGRNSFGFIVQHGNHQHIIPYSQLRGTRWEYLLNNQGSTTNNTNTTVVNTPKTNIANDNHNEHHENISNDEHHDHHEHSTDHDDNYKFDPKDIVAEDENGYTVRHGDHFHYIPKNKVEKTVEAAKPTPVIPTPTVPKESKVEKPAPVIPTPTLPKVKKEETPKVEETVVRPSVLAFAGVQFETSDGFILNENTVGTPTSLGLVIDHNGHQHFVYYKQLVNSKFEKLIPEKYLEQAKKEYTKLEKEVNEKIDYLSKIHSISKEKFSYSSTSNGDAISYNGKVELLKDISINEKIETNNNSESNQENKENISKEKELEEKIDYVAKQLNIDKSSIKLIESAEGKALVYPHGDHSHTILVKDIDTSKPLADPHSNSGAETLKKLGFDDDIIHDIQHASADTDFPTQETNVEKMKEWLKTVKYLNIGQNKDPLKRNGLDLMSNIEVLGIGYTPIDDITPVYKFKKLKQLYVSRTGIKDYSFIKNIPTLEGIDFSENDVQDISFLKDYPNLKLVSAAGNNIENIDVLKNLTNLESLNLDNNKIKDISALKDLNHLRAVSLENNNITKLDALNSKDELERLFLSNNSGLELATLKNDNLEQLTVNNTNIRDLSVVSNLPKLKKIVANDNKITTLSHLKNAKVLESVEVNNNEINSLDFENSTITSLEIKNNKLKEINNINKLSALENLDASGNKISEFPSNKQDKLINLTVNNNVIRTMENVNNLTALKYLTMSNNYVSTLALKEKNKTLEYLDISHNTIPKEELEIPNDGNIPKGIMSNFEKVEGGDIKGNYVLSADYIKEQAEKLQEEILKLKDEKKLAPEIADELKQKARVVYLDMSHSVDQSRNKQIELEKLLNEIRKQVKDNLVEPTNEVANRDNYSEEVTKKINHLAKILGIDPNLIKLVETENGQALTYPHGDHSHTVPLNAIHIDETDVDITEEIQKQINYIAEVYGVPKEAVKVTKDFFVFNEPAHAYDPTHIHPYLIPREKFHIPEVTGDDEVDFENELLALSKRTGIPADKIKRDGDKFVIPHGDHDHFVKILSKGADIYYKNRIPNITGNYVAGDFDKEAVFKRIEELKANNLAKHSNDKKQANRVNRALDQLRATIEELPTNSTNGYLEMLNNFDKKYIQEEANADTSKNDELVKKYNTLLNRIKDTDIEKYGLSKTDLTNELNEASSNKDDNTLNKVSHMLDELQKFEDREGTTTVSYIKYFLENIDSDKIDNQLREELASLVKDSYESQALITRTPMRTLVTRLINAKNALHYALEHNASSKAEFGENYNKLNETDSDGATLRSSAEQFAKEVNDPSFPIEFSNAKYDKADFEKYANKTTETTTPATEVKPVEEKENNTNNDSNTENQPNNEVSTPKEENNTTDNKKVELTPEETAKVNLLAGIFKLSPDSLNVIETPYGKAVNFTLSGKTETILINDIDRLLAALLANAKPKESSTENKNSTTLNPENEVSNSDSNTTTAEPKNSTEKEETSNNTATTTEETSNKSTEEK